MKHKHLLTTAIAAALAIGTAAAIAMFAMGASDTTAGTQATFGPKYTANGELLLPTGWHQWVYLGSPITPNALNGGKAAFPEYHHVYVHPEVYAEYQRTGVWPEGTIMFKELQLTRPGTNPDGSSVEPSGRGYFPGALNGVDISVKDSVRYKDTNGWGFFTFGHHAPPYPASAPLKANNECAFCHTASATKDMVFSKFYEPILSSR